MPSGSIRMPESREPTTAELEQIKAALLARAASFHLYAVMCVLAGLGVTLGITAFFWIAEGMLVFWGLPPVLICSGGGVALLRVKWKAQNDALLVDLEIRKLARREKGLPA